MIRTFPFLLLLALPVQAHAFAGEGVVGAVIEAMQPPDHESQGGGDDE